MADGIILNDNDTVGEIVSTDDIADGGVANGQHVQRVKSGHGPTNEYKDPCLEFPFPSMPSPVFMMKVGMGLVPGVSYVNKFGQNPNVNSGGAEDIWDGSAIYIHQTVAAQLELVSTSGLDSAAGAGARTVLIEGLDTNHSFISETIPTDGVSASNTVKSYLRVFRMRVTSAGVLGQNAGDLMLQGLGGGTVFAQITVSNNQTQMAIYTVPADKTFGIFSIFGSVYTSPTKGYGETELRIRAFGEVFAEKVNLGLASDGTTSYQIDLEFPIIVEAKSDVIMRTITTVNGSLAIGRFSGLLVDN